MYFDLFSLFDTELFELNWYLSDKIIATNVNSINIVSKKLLINKIYY